jgi:hypothetical protein
MARPGRQIKSCTLSESAQPFPIDLLSAIHIALGWNFHREFLHPNFEKKKLDKKMQTLNESIEESKSRRQPL